MTSFLIFPAEIFPQTKFPVPLSLWTSAFWKTYQLQMQAIRIISFKSVVLSETNVNLPSFIGLELKSVSWDFPKQ